jgi:excisionase family DNA binding protein
MAKKARQSAAATRTAPAVPVFLTTREACELARVCRRTLGRWCEAGLVESVRPLAAGSAKRLVRRDSLLAFLGVELEAAA